ncbi:MAG: hypothetical protein KA713_10280 [Chryseotalea sp. WA131a]|jgi:hypothetical protein|nr:MAG: hypothetical protein KA713_10280 [Chryseotalea sp. WA131a]
MNFYEDFDACSLTMIDSIKSILYSRHNNIFDRLDFYNDNIYLEPLIYTYLNQKDDKWLDSIIFGYEKVKKEMIEVFSNHKGAIFLPQIGYFKTSSPDATIILKTTDGKYRLELAGQSLDYAFEPLLFLNFGIEVQKYQHPLVESFISYFTHPNDDNVLSDNVFEHHIEHLNKGLAILKECNSKHFDLLLKSLKRVLLFTAKEPNSFASLEIHNMIFFNVNSWDNEMYFVDHLSHEGAHITFNTLTYDSKFKLFKFHYNMSFSEISGTHDDSNSLYLRFHGLFTFVEITKSLISCIESKVLSEENIHEAKGRLAFQLRRFKNSLSDFNGLDVFESEGLLWFNFFSKVYMEIEKEYGQLVSKYDLSMPSYDFNSKVFREANPLTNNSVI